MAVLNIFNLAPKSRSGRTEDARNKAALRLSQITKSACRRGTHHDEKCSPYVPCSEVCPFIMPPSESEVDGEGLSLEDLAKQLSSLK